MQINNVLTRNHDPAAHGKRTDLFDGVGRQMVDALKPRAAPLGSSNAAAGQILSQYDVRNITPQKFSELLQKLNTASALGKDDLRELSQVRLDLDASGVRPDESVNLVEFYSGRLGDLKQKLDETDPTTDRSALQQSMNSLQKRLDWSQKFATLHAEPNAAGINAVA